MADVVVVVLAGAVRPVEVPGDDVAVGVVMGLSFHSSIRFLKFLVQNYIKLKSDLFRTRSLNFLVQNVGHFTTPTHKAPKT